MGRALQAALDSGSASGGAWIRAHVEASQLAWQHGEQGGGARVRRASDPGHEPFMLLVPESRIGLIWDGGPGDWGGWKVERWEQHLRQD